MPRPSLYPIRYVQTVGGGGWRCRRIRLNMGASRKVRAPVDLHGANGQLVPNLTQRAKCETVALVAFRKISHLNLNLRQNNRVKSTKMATSVGVNGVNSSLESLDEDRKDKALQNEVYYKLKSLAISHPNDVEIIWRLARACHDCSSNVSDLEMQREFIFEGITACEAVLGVPHADLYKWYAILVGLRGKFMKTKEKIVDGYLFAEYVEKALKLRPEDSTIHHLLGRFKFEISTLSWIERKVAATLFAEPPNASFEDAIIHFKKAELLAKEPFLENKLFLGKSYIALGQYKEGVEYLNQIYELPTSDDEPQVLKEVKELLDKYSGYLL